MLRAAKNLVLRKYDGLLTTGARPIGRGRASLWIQEAGTGCLPHSGARQPCSREAPKKLVSTQLLCLFAFDVFVKAAPLNPMPALFDDGFCCRAPAIATMSRRLVHRSIVGWSLELKGTLQAANSPFPARPNSSDPGRMVGGRPSHPANRKANHVIHPGGPASPVTIIKPFQSPCFRRA